MQTTFLTVAVRLRELVQENAFFFLLNVLLLLLGGYPLLAFDQATLFLKLNQWHSLAGDRFFYYISYLGSSPMYALFVGMLVMFQQSMRTVLTGMSSFAVMSIIVQGMKRVLYADQLRPRLLLPEQVSSLLTSIIPSPETHFSFPSGHAATVFAMVCLIHLSLQKKSAWLTILLLVSATMVAYARVYLCQHFYQDVYVGACIGTWTTKVCYGIFMCLKGPAWLNAKWRVVWPGKYA